MRLRLSIIIVVWGCIVISTSAFEPASLNQLGLTEGPLQSTGIQRNQTRDDSLETDRQFWMNSGYFRQYELSDFDTRFLTAGTWLGQHAVVLGLSQLGNPDYYAEQVLQVGVGHRLRRFQIGLNMSLSKQSFGEHYSSLSAATWGVAASWQTQRISITLVADDLSRPKFHNASIPTERKASVYIGIVTTDESRLWLRQDFQKGYPPRYRFTQLFSLNRTGTIFWDFSSNPSSYGGGLKLSFSSYNITYAASHHPVLGLSHGLSIGYNEL